MNTLSKIDLGTQGVTKFSRTLSGGFGLLRRHVWLWPLLAAAMLAAAGVWIRSSVERAAKKQLADSLTTILDADVAALNIWMGNHRMQAQSLADDPRVRRLSVDLIAAAQQATAEDTSPLLQSDAQSEFRTLLRPELNKRGYTGFVLLEKSGTILSSDHSELVGLPAPPKYAELLARTIESGAIVSQPFPSVVLLRDVNRELRAASRRADDVCSVSRARPHGRHRWRAGLANSPRD